MGRGTLGRAEAILAAHPEVRACDVHTAAILGDDVAVRRFLAEDTRNATESRGSPRLGRAHLPLLLAVPASRPRSGRRLRAGGEGAPRRRRQRRDGVLRGRAHAPRVGERALRSGRRRSSRRARAAPPRARGGPERRRDGLPRPGDPRQRGAAGPRGERPALSRQPRDPAGPQGRLARRGRRPLPARARRRSQPDDTLGLHRSPPGRTSRQRPPDLRADAGPRGRPRNTRPAPPAGPGGRAASRRSRSPRAGDGATSSRFSSGGGALSSCRAPFA